MSAELPVVAERFTFFMAQSSALVTQHCHLMTLSANDLVRPRQHPLRNRHTYLLGGFQVDEELELGWPLGRELRRVLPFKEFVHVCRGGSVRRIGDITDKAPSSTASGLD